MRLCLHSYLASLLQVEATMVITWLDCHNPYQHYYMLTWTYFLGILVGRFRSQTGSKNKKNPIYITKTFHVTYSCCISTAWIGTTVLCQVVHQPKLVIEHFNALVMLAAIFC